MNQTERFLSEQSTTWTKATFYGTLAISFLDAILSSSVGHPVVKEKELADAIMERTQSSFMQRMETFRMIQEFNDAEAIEGFLRRGVVKNLVHQELVERTDGGNCPTIVFVYRTYVFRLELTLVAYRILEKYYIVLLPQQMPFLRKQVEEEKQSCNARLAAMQLKIIESGLSSWL